MLPLLDIWECIGLWVTSNELSGGKVYGGMSDNTCNLVRLPIHEIRPNEKGGIVVAHPLSIMGMAADDNWFGDRLARVRGDDHNCRIRRPTHQTGAFHPL